MPSLVRMIDGLAYCSNHVPFRELSRPTCGGTRIAWLQGYRKNW